MYKTKIFALSALVLSLGISGCNHDDDASDTPTVTTSSYLIKVTNITNNQPLTAVAFVMHQSGYTAWMLGSSVSVGLEELAESGSPATFIEEATANSAVLATASLADPIGPGNNRSVTITVNDSDELMLSVASMLENTNDAFSSVSSWDVSGLSSGETMTIMSKVYDAGTEVNDEANIPGPAAGGEGFNADRATDGLDKVTIHPGVVTTADGLSTSALDESHRWLTYAAKISITKN